MIFGKLDKVVDGLAIAGKRYGYYCIFIIIIIL